MDITVGTNSWLTYADASLYFEEKFPSTHWDSAEDSNRKKALATAYRDLNAMDGYSFVSTPSDAMKNAQCEQAYFLLAWGDDMERRDALREAGVSTMSVGKAFSEGMTKMSSQRAGLGSVTIAPRALDLLKSYKTPTAPIVIGDLERDDTIE
jgi:hypothetical protein